MAHVVQMITENYDILNNPHLLDKYPNLYFEVFMHDREYHNSWYKLSAKAYSEYLKYMNDIDIN